MDMTDVRDVLPAVVDGVMPRAAFMVNPATNKTTSIIVGSQIY
jgi:hypothetical protein